MYAYLGHSSIAIQSWYRQKSGIKIKNVKWPQTFCPYFSLRTCCPSIIIVSYSSWKLGDIPAPAVHLLLSVYNASILIGFTLAHKKKKKTRNSTSKTKYYFSISFWKILKKKKRKKLLLITFIYRLGAIVWFMKFWNLGNPNCKIHVDSLI